MAENLFSNPLIVSQILEHLPTRDYLTCRLINKLWKEEVEHRFHKAHFHLCVGPYMKQYRNGIKLPRNSVLTKKITLGSDYCDDGGLYFRSFIRQRRHGNVEVINLELLSYGFCWGRALLETFQQNYCPNLTELYLSGFEFLCHSPQSGWGNVQLYLPNIKIFHMKFGLSSHKDFFALAKKIINGSPNLEELCIEGMFFPDLSANGKLKYLYLKIYKLLHYNMHLVEPVLQTCATSLEELVLNITRDTWHGERLFLPNICFKLPVMPKLRKYLSTDFTLNPFPFRQDFITFLDKTLPSLEVLELLECKPLSVGERELYNNIPEAISRSFGKNEKVKKLTIPSPANVQLLSSFKEKFPNLCTLVVKSMDKTDKDAAENVKIILELAKTVEDLKIPLVKIITSHDSFSLMNIVETSIMEFPGFKGKVTTSYVDPLSDAVRSSSAITAEGEISAGIAIVIRQSKD